MFKKKITPADKSRHYQNQYFMYGFNNWKSKNEENPIICLSIKPHFSCFFLGDDLYPEEPNIFGSKSLLTIEGTLSELDTKYKNYNRYVLKKKESKVKFMCNVSTGDGHVIPLTDFSFIGPNWDCIYSQQHMKLFFELQNKSYFHNWDLNRKFPFPFIFKIFVELE